MIKYYLLYLIIIFTNIILCNEKIQFLSANPFSFNHIIQSLDSQISQEVYGILKLPINFKENQKYALVIGVAGSLDWKDHHREQLEMYRENGIATFELHSFNSRGIESTVGTQISVTTAMLILDSYKALDVLANHKNIDKDNVGIVGWSLGGGTALFSGWKPLIEAISPKNNFAAHLAYYPPCIIIPTNTEFTDAPIQILIGADDDWTPALACEELVKLINKDNINLIIYENSHHSFDSKLKLRYVENGYSLTDCRFSLRDDGSVLMNFLGIPMSYPILQKISLGLCASRGTTIEGNSIARVKALNISLDFMLKNLLDIK